MLGIYSTHPFPKQNPTTQYSQNYREIQWWKFQRTYKQRAEGNIQVHSVFKTTCNKSCLMAPWEKCHIQNFVVHYMKILIQKQNGSSCFDTKSKESHVF